MDSVVTPVISPRHLKEWADKQDKARGNPVTVDPRLGERCVYVGAEGSHCIAGQYLSDLGISDEMLIEYEWTNADDVVRHLYNDGLLAGDENEVDEVADLLFAMQRTADRETGMGGSQPWGQAIKILHEELSRN